MTGGYSPTSRTRRKSTSSSPARSANPRPAAPRSTSFRAPAAIASPATSTRPTRRGRGSTRNTSGCGLPEQRRIRAIFDGVSAHPRPRRVGGVRRPDQARPAVVLLGGARPGRQKRAQPADRLLAQPERRHLGLQLPAGPVAAAAANYTNSDAQRQRAHHVPGHAEEQVQLLLGREDFCQDPCDGVVSVFTSRDVVVRSGASRTGCSRCRGRIR